MKAVFPLQEKVHQLEEIQQYFQRPDMNLEEAIEKHKVALGVAKEIIRYLETAENSLEKVDISSLQGSGD